MFEFKPAKKKTTLLYGVATNDADYQVVYKDDQGKRVICPYYARWKAMLVRVYDPKYLSHSPTYEGCTLHPNWLMFSNFRKWMSLQDWPDKHIDKDLLIQGNKEYGPDTCLFISAALNNLLCLRANNRGELPLGVTLMTIKGHKYFVAVCSFYGKQKKLGYFKTVEEASTKYLVEKNAYIKKLAAEEQDPQVAAALARIEVC